MNAFEEKEKAREARLAGLYEVSLDDDWWEMFDEAREKLRQICLDLNAHQPPLGKIAYRLHDVTEEIEYLHQARLEGKV